MAISCRIVDFSWSKCVIAVADGVSVRAPKLAHCDPKRFLVSASLNLGDVEDKAGQRWPHTLCAGLAAALVFLTPQSESSSWWPSLRSLSAVQPASASGLLLMPPRELKNRYFLVRAGLSNFESMGVIHTNPVTKTNVDSGLSVEGIRQSTDAAKALKDLGACEENCWIWPSITQRSYQAAELIAYFNNIAYSRIVPEYSFLDARGLGAYEGRDLSAISEIYANDSESVFLKPPSFTDGTPNESVIDVLVRVTQLMSILETQYSGDTVVIVSPTRTTCQYCRLR